ncbi:hypothetical protein B0H13DRAFT_2264217 [Mycena leptocephala]|nr:hypothetical protein B0H13DRAFT_2264217 [Mycena leptocephala]
MNNRRRMRVGGTWRLEVDGLECGGLRMSSRKDFVDTTSEKGRIEAAMGDLWRRAVAPWSSGRGKTSPSECDFKIVLGCDSDLLTHFEELAANDCLPTLNDLLDQASIIRERYACQAAYDQSLDKSDQDAAAERTKFPEGSVWTPSNAPEPPAVPLDPDINMPDPKDVPNDPKDTSDDEPSPEGPSIVPDQDSPESAADKDGPKIHKEPPGFDGDRLLSNAIPFLMEFGWWVELNYAIPEGDVGRVLEILKIFIFTFGGSSNQNYMGYMLDLYALLEFECSPDLKEALLNNYLFNLGEEVGNFIEGDLMQEWNNRWLQDASGRGGGDFDDKFYRKTISPNVLHFLKMKEDIETAFELKRRSKAHPSPHLRDETKVLLRLYQEEELHHFRSGRSMGHAAVNRFDRGYQRLDNEKMAEYLQRSKEYADVLEEMEILRNGGTRKTLSMNLDNGDESNSSTSSSDSDENQPQNLGRISSPDDRDSISSTPSSSPSAHTAARQHPVWPLIA